MNKPTRRSTFVIFDDDNSVIRLHTQNESLFGLARSKQTDLKRNEQLEGFKFLLP